MSMDVIEYVVVTINFDMNMFLYFSDPSQEEEKCLSLVQT